MKKTLLLSLILILSTACQPKTELNQVVVYVSVDQVYAEPILKLFEQQSGILVLPVYDVEAAKTTGLVNRLMAEKNHPQADVYWSGEFAQTLLLKEEGLLEAYQPENAVDLPLQYRDPDGTWTAFAGRARILLVNTDLVQAEQMPNSVLDLAASEIAADKIGMAYPLFGTTATHAAALYAVWGADAAVDYYRSLKEKGIRVVDGNSVVRDLVASGELAFGITDTDDACRAVEEGKPVRIIFPDQHADQPGVLVIPNTVAMIAGGPHPQQARTFIDFMTSTAVEQELVNSGWSQFPLRPVDKPPVCGGGPEIKTIAANLEDIYGLFELSKQDLTEIFIR
jgi:iron(III) transport system substrate-binding protein